MRESIDMQQPFRVIGKDLHRPLDTPGRFRLDRNALGLVKRGMDDAYGSVIKLRHLNVPKPVDLETRITKNVNEDKGIQWGQSEKVSIHCTKTVHTLVIQQPLAPGTENAGQTKSGGYMEYENVSQGTLLSPNCRRVFSS